MNRAKIIITGEKTHDIGYRVFLLTNALNFGLTNFNAYNAQVEGRQAIIVLVGGDGKEVLSDFYSYIKENIPDEAQVSEIKIEDFKGRIMDIDKYLHLIQVEQLNKGIPAIIEIRDNTKSMLQKQDSMLEKQDSMLEKQDSMLEKQDSMLEKQDTTISILKSVKEDTSDIKSTLSRIEIDVKDTKFSLSSYIEEKHRKLEREIADIKTTLARIQEAG